MYTKTKTNTEPPQTMVSTLTINQQQNHCLRMDSSLSYRAKGISLAQIFALDSVVVKTLNCSARTVAS